MICGWHLCENEVINSNRPEKRFCSPACKVKWNVVQCRRRRKQKAIDYKGGKCERCGYNKCPRALVFHHRDPTTKEFSIAAKGYTRSWEAIQLELDKCDLLCANCHSEVEDILQQDKEILFGGLIGKARHC